MLQQQNCAFSPNFPFKDFAVCIASSEKSTPTTLAPIFNRDSVSMPKWHWRWRIDFPRMCPSKDKSKSGTAPTSFWIYPSRKTRNAGVSLSLHSTLLCLSYNNLPSCISYLLPFSQRWNLSIKKNAENTLSMVSTIPITAHKTICEKDRTVTFENSTKE